MGSQSPTDTYSPEETERRMNDAMRRALNTPPQHKTKPKKESNQPVSVAGTKGGGVDRQGEAKPKR